MKKPYTINITNCFDRVSIPALVEESDKKSSNGWFVLLHGLTTSKNEYLNFYDDVANGLLKCGYSSLRIDFRAHGESLSNASAFNVTNNVSDVVSSVRWLIKNKGIEKINLFGTSFGAVAALASASVLPDELVKRIYLLAPVLSFNDLYLNPISNNRKEKYGNMLQKVLLEDKIILLDDRVSFNYSNAIEFALIDMPRLVNMLADKLTIMHGTHDTIVPLEVTKALVESIPSISYHEFERMDHGFTDIDDEEGVTEASKRNLADIIGVLCGKRT